MPLFSGTKTTLSTVGQTNFADEKALQKLIEHNLECVFGCRFVATEFSTGVQHAGRIDTLAISEDNNPVIIEYKKVESEGISKLRLRSPWETVLRWTGPIFELSAWPRTTKSMTCTLFGSWVRIWNSGPIDSSRTVRYISKRSSRNPSRLPHLVLRSEMG